MSGLKVFCYLWLLCMSTSHSFASGQDFDLPAPSSEPDALPVALPGECGFEKTRLTLCFPGSPQNATCSYNVELNATSDEIRPHSPQIPCPQDFLFGHSCLLMAGTIYFAFGPCNSDDVPETQRADNTKDITNWIDVLGLRTTKVLGGIFVRGYAYQPGFATSGINLFPSLTSLRPPQLLVLNGKKYTQVTFSGLATPALPEVSSIPAGLSILDSPDVDFFTPPRFLHLTNITNGVSIAGCTNLKSLSGLDGLVGAETVTNMLVIYNPILEDISALAGLFKCQGAGSMARKPDAIVGTVEVHPLPLQPLGQECILSTADEICTYISNKTQCPDGTQAATNQHNLPLDILGAPTPR